MKLTRRQVEALVVIESTEGRTVPSRFAARFWRETWQRGGAERRRALLRTAGSFLRRMSDAGLLTQSRIGHDTAYHTTFEYALTHVARKGLAALRASGDLATPTKLVRKAPARPHTIDCDMDEDCTCGARTGGWS